MRRSLLSALLIAILLGTWSVCPAQTKKAKKAAKPKDVAAAADSNAATPGTKPVVTVVFSGYDAMLGDIGWIGKLAGKPGLPKMFEKQIGLSTGGKGLAGLDKKRPWGMLVSMSPTSLSPAIQGFMPVTSLKQLLSSLEPVLGEPKEEGGVFQINASGQTLFAKEQKGWAVFSQDKDSLASAPADPTEAFDGLAEQYLVAVRVKVSNLPEGLRQMIKPLLQAGIQASLSERMPGESDEQFAIRKKAAEQALAQFNTLLEELDALTLGLAVDQKGANVHLDVTLTARPGSKTATQLAAAGGVKSQFAGFLMRDAAAALNMVQKMDESDTAQLKTLLAAARNEVPKAIDDTDLTADQKKAYKGILTDLVEQMGKTLEQGTLDGGAVLKLDPKATTAAAGFLVADGAKLNGTVKQLLERLAKDEPETFKGLKLDAEEVKGVHLHQVGIPLDRMGMSSDDKEKFAGLVGDPMGVVVGVGEKNVYVAVGRKPADLIKAVIEGSATATGGDKPLEFFVAGTPIARMVAQMGDGPEKDAAAAVEKILAQSEGKDRFLMTGSIVKNGMQVRFEVQEGILRLLSLAPIPGLGDE